MCGRIGGGGGVHIGEWVGNRSERVRAFIQVKNI